MARTHKPRQAPRVPLKLSCPCGATVTTMTAPSPDVDEGWPMHRCPLARMQPRPFAEAERANRAKAVAA